MGVDHNAHTEPMAPAFEGANNHSDPTWFSAPFIRTQGKTVPHGDGFGAFI